MTRAVVVGAVPTPVGRYGGGLAGVRPDDLAAAVIAALVERTGVDPGAIEDVYLGCANRVGEDNRNVARMAALLAGLPGSVAGVTVNRLCASGLTAVVAACHAVVAGDGDLFVAGGVGSMSRAPLVVGKPETALPRGDRTLWDTTLGWRFPKPGMEAMFPLESMGRDGRERRRALRGRPRGSGPLRLRVAAPARCRADPRPLRCGDRRRRRTRQRRAPAPGDEPREAVGLKPAFRQGGTVTAGNSSGIKDGAAALLIGSEARAATLRLEPLGRFLGSAVSGVDPRLMGIGPVPAVRRLLERTGVEIAEIDLVELNEAFASQSLAVIRELGLDPARVNVNGGDRDRPPARYVGRAPGRDAPARAAPPWRPLRPGHALRRGRPGQAALFARGA